MSNGKIERNFAMVGLLSIIIIVLCTQIILNLETNSESFIEDGIFIVPLLFLIICLILILTIIYQKGPFNEGKLQMTRDDFSLLLLLISMFIIGLIIFCAYVFTLFTIIIKSNNAQQKDLDNDPELKGKL